MENFHVIAEDVLLAQKIKQLDQQHERLWEKVTVVEDKQVELEEQFFEAAKKVAAEKAAIATYQEVEAINKWQGVGFNAQLAEVLEPEDV